MQLKVTNHDRDVLGTVYVYPVVSRRAGGLSIGINLNPNNACNYRCVYCQVPNLVYGKGPAIELGRLELELRGLLDEVLHGDFLARALPSGARLTDIALSGNGEPTSSPQFLEVLHLLERVLSDLGLVGQIPVVLITNGTLTDRPAVEAGLVQLAALGGRVWFKLDSATRAGTERINDNASSMEARVERLVRVAAVCPTYLQTCVFQFDGEPWSAQERAAYLELLAALKARAVPLEGVLLYGLARASHQPEAPRLSRVSDAWLHALGASVEAVGFPVTVTP